MKTKQDLCSISAVKTHDCPLLQQDLDALEVNMIEAVLPFRVEKDDAVVISSKEEEIMT